jgi:hypothetical protein
MEVGYLYSTKSADHTFVLFVLPKREPPVRKLVMRSLCGKCKTFISVCVRHWKIEKMKNSPLIPSKKGASSKKTCNEELI